MIHEYKNVITISMYLCMIFGVYAEDVIPQQIPENRIREQMLRAGWAANQDNCTETIKAFERTIQEHRGTEIAMQAQTEIAAVRIKVGDIPGAEAAVRKLLEEYSDKPNIPSRVRMISDKYVSANQPQKARQLCQQALSRWPEHREALLLRCNLAIASIQLSDYAQAETETKQLVSNYHDDKSLPKAIRTIAGAYFQAGQDTRALELYQSLAASWSDHKETILAQQDIAIGYIERGAYEQADAAVTELIRRYPEPDVTGNCVRHVGAAYSKEGNTEKGEALIKLASTRWPHKDEVFPLRDAACQHVQQGDYAQADTIAAKLISDHAYSSRAGNCVRRIAKAYLMKEEYERAKQLFQQALANFPDHSEAKFTQGDMARIALITGDAEKGLEECTKSDKVLDGILQEYVRKSDAKAIFELGEEYYLWGQEASQNNQQEHARADYSRALEVWQKNIDLADNSKYQCLANYYSGLICQRLEQYEAALGYYNRVLSTWPSYENNYFIQFQIAKIYEKLNKEGKASDQDVQSAYQTLKDKYSSTSAGQIAEKKLEKF